ncbi:MAG: tetratricopeptide repeat protein [Elusimicrobiota bacterium]
MKKHYSLLLFISFFYFGVSFAPLNANSGVQDGNTIRTFIDGENFTQARKAIKSWQDKDPKASTPWVFLAEVEYHEKNLKKTISAAQKALDRNPMSAEAYYWKGMALSGQGKHLEAINELKAAQRGPHPHIPAAKAQENIEAKLNFSAQQK